MDGGTLFHSPLSSLPDRRDKNLRCTPSIRADFKVLLSTLKPFKGQDLFTSLNFTPAAPQSDKNEIQSRVDRAFAVTAH